MTMRQILDTDFVFLQSNTFVSRTARTGGRSVSRICRKNVHKRHVSAGCCAFSERVCQMPRKFRDLTNVRVGRLVAQWPVGRTKTSHNVWLCCCDCGKLLLVLACELTKPRSYTKSCGCKRSEGLAERNRTKSPNLIHGDARRGKQAGEFNIWKLMIYRCEVPRSKDYKHYGGRGIQICERWRNSYSAFLADMGRRPHPSLTLERIDNNGNYEPGNCKWATRKEQHRNTRNNRQVSYMGRTQPLSAWAEEYGLNWYQLGYRLNAGWSVGRALSEPLHMQNSSRFRATRQ